MDAGRPLADWRSPVSYAALASCGRHAFAWEWLRRSPVYAAAVAQRDALAGAPAAFGLHAFEPFERAFAEARPIWCAEVDPYVLAATAEPVGPRRDGIDFAALAGYASLALGRAGTEHWLWSNGIRQIRLDIVEGTLRAGPVRLECRIVGFRSALPQAIVLQRLVALVRSGRFVTPLFPHERRAPRWARVLQTHDALAAGASRREIAERYFGVGYTRRWRIEAPSYYQRVRRLALAAQEAATVDPRRWLNGSYP